MNKEIKNQTNDTIKTVVCVSGTGMLVTAFTIAYSVHQSRKNRKLERENEKLMADIEQIKFLCDLACTLARLEVPADKKKSANKESTTKSNKTETK